MKHLKHYQTPEILREVPFLLEAALLADSVVNKANVTSMGQKVEDYDFAAEGNTFNHQWEP